MALRVIHGDDQEYTIDKLLGRGGFGSVYKVRRKVDGQVLARKTMKLKVEHVDLIVREVVAMRTLTGCRNVVQWLPDVVFDKEDMMIHLHMQYYPDGDLEGLIGSYTQSPVPKDTATQVFCCLAMALLDCHRRGICHRDIKPPNVLVSRKIWNGQQITIAYLADFGLVTRSKVALTSGFTIQGAGSPGTSNYMAPESIDFDSPIFSERSDLFSLGCTMYRLFNRQEAYVDYSRDRVPSMSSTAVREYGGRLCPLVTSLMQLLPAQRPGTEQLVASLETYCLSRWEKQKAAMLWKSLAVVSGTNGGPPMTGMAPPPPWEQQQQQKQQPFQLPSELLDLRPPPQYYQQQQQQQHNQVPMLRPALQQARQARQAQQQRVAALQKTQVESVRLQQQQQQLQQQQFQQQFQQQQQFGAKSNAPRP